MWVILAGDKIEEQDVNEYEDNLLFVFAKILVSQSDLELTQVKGR